MAAGFVYIFLNVSFPELVKIGRTTVSVEERARQLSSSTGLPTPFMVIYDELVDDCEAVERLLHQRFDAYRVRGPREFFRIPVREAIRVLKSEAETRRGIQVTRDEHEITAELRQTFGTRLKPDITTVKIVNLPLVVYLECTRTTGVLFDEIVERTDLSFIAEDDEGDWFQPSDGARANAAKFLELDAYSLINCTSNLFTSGGADEIAREHESRVGTCHTGDENVE
jgi:hypothetical protein